MIKIIQDCLVYAATCHRSVMRLTVVLNITSQVTKSFLIVVMPMCIWRFVMSSIEEECVSIKFSVKFSNNTNCLQK